MRSISENCFHDHFKPLVKPSGDFLGHADTLEYPVEQVWTIIEGDSGNLYASPGYHVVNRLGYVVTEVPWTDSTRNAVYFGR